MLHIFEPAAAQLPIHLHSKDIYVRRLHAVAGVVPLPQPRYQLPRRLSPPAAAASARCRVATRAVNWAPIDGLVSDAPWVAARTSWLASAGSVAGVCRSRVPAGRCRCQAARAHRISGSCCSAAHGCTFVARRRRGRGTNGSCSPGCCGTWRRWRCACPADSRHTRARRSDT